MPNSRLNIIFITTDQQRYDIISALGYPYMMDTPNLDRWFTKDDPDGSPCQ